MTNTERCEVLAQLCARVQECIAPYAGRVEYGNLRCRIDEWDCDSEGHVTNIALVYETPGGSTDQINVSFEHKTETFVVVDAQAGERRTDSVDDVLDCVAPRVHGIPQKRLDSLCEEIRRQIDGGSNTAGLFGALNRMMQSEFKGGGITHLELRDAMTYAVQYMKNGSRPNTSPT